MYHYNQYAFILLILWFYSTLSLERPHVCSRIYSKQWYACKLFDPLNPSANESSCLKAVVPGTVLSTLLENKVFNFTDPYFEDNLRLIPDISTTGPEYYTYWFVMRFNDHDLNDCLDTERKQIHLSFRGINYRASIYLNGKLLSKSSTSSGMFLTREFDVTELINDADENFIAVLVLPPDFIGKPGGQGGDHQIARNGAIMQFSCGWDWIMATPDRNTGIWDKVSFYITGQAKIIDPVIETYSIDIDTKTAVINPTATVHSSVDGFCGVLVLNLACDAAAFTGTYKSDIFYLNRSQDLQVSVGETTLSEVSLWWPVSFLAVGLSPSLYHAKFELIDMTKSNCRGDDSPPIVADQISFNHGIRKIETFIHPDTGGQAFKINDQQIFLTGGNWIATDQMLRYSRGDVISKERYHYEVKMHAEMGMNLIRVWGGSITERPEFYDECDKQGVLVFQEFWMTGDNNGRWGGEASWPDDHSSYLANAKSAILSTRTHPSLLLWCFGNELDPDGKSPPEDIRTSLQDLLKQYDPGRFFIPSSMAPQSTNPADFNPKYALSPQDGPYGILYPFVWYQERNPGLVGYNETPIAFNPEVGSVSCPTVSSMRRFLTAGSLNSFPQQFASSLNGSWGYHKYISFTTTDTVEGEHDFIYSYGSPVDIDEYSIRAQLVQYEQYRALFEGYRLYQWKYYNAVLMWKSQSPWPTFRGALYDYYLEQTGGFFGVKKAHGSVELGGLHVQLNPRTLEISVINTHAQEYTNDILVFAEIADLKGQILVNKKFYANEISGKYVLTFEEHLLWPNQCSINAVCLVILNLQSKSVITIKEKSSYWMSNPSDSGQNYTALGDVRTNARANGGPELVGSVSCGQLVDDVLMFDAVIKNNEIVDSVDDNVALFTYLSVHFETMDPTEDDRILPVWYEDNYVTILPGEVWNTYFSIRRQNFDSIEGLRYVLINGWNVFNQNLKFELEICVSTP